MRSTVSCSKRLASVRERGWGKYGGVRMYGTSLTKLIHTPQITNECLAVPQDNQYSLCIYINRKGSVYYCMHLAATHCLSPARDLLCQVSMSPDLQRCYWLVL